MKTNNILEEADDKTRELLEVFLAAELGVEQHDQVAGVGLGWPRLRIQHQSFIASITCVGRCASVCVSVFVHAPICRNN